jgi:hypothetical protein
MLRRIQNQPAAMNIVLTALSEALIAGKSLIVIGRVTVAAVSDRRILISALRERRYSLKSATLSVAVE